MEYVYTGVVPRFKIIVDSRECQGESMPFSSTKVIDVECMQSVLSLLTAADQFMVDHLIEVCEKLLQSTVTSKTVHMLLRSAEMSNAFQLKSVCLHYLRNAADDSATQTSLSRQQSQNSSSSSAAANLA